MPTEKTMYKALVKKDPAYEGVFVAAVKTTGIFCRPTCRARKPDRKNVEFFKSAREAMMNGYRPCKVCRPLEKSGETPPQIKRILNEIEKRPMVKIRDADFRSQGIEPHTIRRWFLKNHGMTFHAYQRMLRINAAVKQMRNGDKVTDAAFDTGYGSLSGFADSFKSIVGKSPSESRNIKVINLTRIATPLGMMVACADETGLYLLEFADRRMLETELKYLKRHLKATIIVGENEILESLKQQLADYFEGILKRFSLPLLTPGTKFQQAVWNELQKIPHGTTRSYKQIAVALKQPTAVRAVANANGMNRLAIIIPCHRVIGSSGHLTGYGGGLWRKKWLLEHEQNAGTPKRLPLQESHARAGRIP